MKSVDHTLLWASSCQPMYGGGRRVTGPETLEQAGYHVITTTDRESILRTLDASSPVLLVADFEMLYAGEDPLLLQLAQRLSHQALSILAIILGEELFPDWMWDVDKTVCKTVCFLRTPFQEEELTEYVRRIIKANENSNTL